MATVEALDVAIGGMDAAADVASAAVEAVIATTAATTATTAAMAALTTVLATITGSGDVKVTDDIIAVGIALEKAAEASTLAGKATSSAAAIAVATARAAAAKATALIASAKITSPTPENYTLREHLYDKIDDFFIHCETDPSKTSKVIQIALSSFDKSTDPELFTFFDDCLSDLRTIGYCNLWDDDDEETTFWPELSDGPPYIEDDHMIKANKFFQTLDDYSILFG
ncbi:MAG: hypothetical protein Hyperionvirus24_12 [Hyperionvirus sp.]|uniref:Uncharacterized protein n=1 Tax=Hyperionvirus sp. TaxID=2487770 RepID=A0A3G5AAY0_9VIRU|nr:MAG: hypothetical protein Hyperionvirus24_12 [Hyperionvirus sp.]